jgi:hypothetical protein
MTATQPDFVNRYGAYLKKSMKARSAGRIWRRLG